jgi:cytochrome c553
MRVIPFLIAAALSASAQAPQTPGPMPAGPVPPRMPAVVQTCVPCHGARGEGSPAAGSPRIAAQSQYYIRKQLDSYADGSRLDPVMEPIAKGLSPELRAAVAAHYAQLEAPAASGASVFTQSWVERGRRLATQGDHAIRVQACVNCHGPGGTGEPPVVPYIAGLDDGYLRSTLNAWREGRRRNDAGQQMADVANALQPDDIAAVARYYAGLTPPSAAPLNLILAARPQLMAAGTTPSITLSPNTANADGAGVESGATTTGGEYGRASSGARSGGGQNANAPAAGGAPGRGPAAPAGGARPSAEDAARGRALIASGAYGCAACHAIPGIRSPRGIVGPDLIGFARRPFIAGQLPNTSEVLVAFLQNPPGLVPSTGMPNVGLSLEDARRMAAYLYTVERSGER